MNKELKENDKEMLDICYEAIERYGESNQVIVAIEEMAELQKELTKFLRGPPDMLSISEEIADVQIMLIQLQLMFDNSLQVQDEMDYKIKRLHLILNGEYK